jgi:hypothetical protein
MMRRRRIAIFPLANLRLSLTVAPVASETPLHDDMLLLVLCQTA